MSGAAHDRRDWLLPMAISIVIHATVIALLIQTVRRPDPLARGAMEDVPLVNTVPELRDSARIAGIGPDPSARWLVVICRYRSDRNGLARLIAGPRQKGRRLGCKDTLRGSTTVPWQQDLEAGYTPDGRLVEINGDYVSEFDSRDPLVRLVQSWDLAATREGRKWPAWPLMVLRMEECCS